jgi:hypothetical protein
MRAVAMLLLTAASLAAAACSTTVEGKPKNIKFSGFLGNYSDLKRGGPGQPAYIYIKPGLNLAPYTKIMLDPPQAWLSPEQREKIGEQELTNLLTSLDKALRDSLGAKWELVDRPAVDVIRIRFCIDNASDAVGVLTPFTRILPWGLVAQAGVKVATGEYLNVGTITTEQEILDGGTGQRLEAAVDQREGGNSVENVFSNWGDVVDALRYWSDRMASRLVAYGMKPTK